MSDQVTIRDHKATIKNIFVYDPQHRPAPSVMPRSEHPVLKVNSPPYLYALVEFEEPFVWHSVRRYVAIGAVRRVKNYTADDIRAQVTRELELELAKADREKEAENREHARLQEQRELAARLLRELREQ